MKTDKTWNENKCTKAAKWFSGLCPSWRSVGWFQPKVPLSLKCRNGYPAPPGVEGRVSQCETDYITLLCTKWSRENLAPMLNPLDTTFFFKDELDKKTRTAMEKYSVVMYYVITREFKPVLPRPVQAATPYSPRPHSQHIALPPIS